MFVVGGLVICAVELDSFIIGTVLLFEDGGIIVEWECGITLAYTVRQMQDMGMKPHEKAVLAITS